MSFGTKRAQKALSSIAKNSLNTGVPRGQDVETIRLTMMEHPSAAQTLESLVESLDGEMTQAVVQAAIDAARPRPKYNADAKRTEDVYTAEQLVGEDLMKELQVSDWIELINAEKAIPAPDGPQLQILFTLYRMTGLVQNENIAKLKVLKYLNYLLLFWQSLSRAPTGAGRKLPWSRDLLRHTGASEALMNIIKQRFVGKK